MAAFFFSEIHNHQNWLASPTFHKCRLSFMFVSLILRAALAAPAAFAPQLDLQSLGPDTAVETAISAYDQQPLSMSPRDAFRGFSVTSKPTGPWVVRAQYQSIAQLNLVLRRFARQRVYPERGIVIFEINSLLDYDQLVRDGLTVELDLVRTQELAEFLTRPLPELNSRSIPGFSCYRTVEETFATAEALVAQNPGIAEWIDFGDSQLKALNQGGYDLRALHIGNRSIQGPKPTLMIQGAIHAREYVTAEAVTRFAEQLVQGYQTNPDNRWLIDFHDTYLVLVANPDGRKVAETASTQLARKNRNPNFFCSTDPVQTGVDLNRNYPFDFGGPGTSTVVCNQTYRGPSAASESESQALTSLARAIFPDQRAETQVVPPDQTTPISLDATGVYVDVHSNGAGIWFPWGNTNAGSAPNQAQVQTFSRKFGFNAGLPAARSSTFGAIGGATDDWTFGTLGVMGFTLELGGSSFFPACSTFESSIGPPAVAAFFMALRHARAPYRTPAGPDVLSLSASPNAGGATITASVSDTRFNPSTEPSQNIASVALYRQPPWSGSAAIANFSAVDGSFNSTVENVSLNLTNLQLPTQPNTIYYAVATDAAGNVGAPSALFLNPASNPDRLFSNAFEP